MTTHSDTPRTSAMVTELYEDAAKRKKTPGIAARDPFDRALELCYTLERELSALTAQLAEAQRDAEKMRKRHESSHAEVLRLADELRKRDPTWGSPMRLNNAAIRESKK